MKKTRVLVTGGAGYIGSHVVHYLLRNDYEIIVYDNLSNGSKEVIPGHVKLIVDDIRNAERVEKVIKAYHPDMVIHLAALKSVKITQNCVEYTDVNITGTLNVVNAMVRNKVPYFVFSSSAAVFGEPQYLPIDEEHVKFPINYYGETKLIIEQILSWYSKLYPFYYISLRYFNAAGHEPDANFISIEKTPENLIPIIMETAIGQRKKFSIFGNDYNTEDGTCIRDYIHVSDLAVAHVQALSYLEEKKQSISLNLGTGVGFSTKQIYDAAVRVTNKKIPMYYADRRKGDLESLYAKSVRANKVLRWKPKFTNIDDTILHSWVAYLKHSQT